MAKINLLPDYIWEGKRRTRTVMAVLAALVIELLALGFLVVTTKNNLKAAEDARDQSQTQAKQVDDLNSKAKSITGQIKPITDKTKYIVDVLTYDRRFPDLFERTNVYTTSRVGYRQLQPAQSVLNITAYTRNVGDVGRYLLNIQRAKDMFTTVSITSQMPGWPAGSSANGGSPTPTVVPSSYTPGGGFGPFGSGGGFNPGGATAGIANPAGPNLLEFTAVGQLTQPFQFNPPIYAAAGSTDQSGGGGPTGGYGTSLGPGTGPTGPKEGPGAGGANGGGANGGGANGGGANGGGS